MLGNGSRWTVSVLLLATLLPALADPTDTSGDVVHLEAPGAQPDAPATPLAASELDQLLAPIALYPDALLAQALMAAAYPLDIVEANRWNQERAGWSPDALAAAAKSQSWDPSVKALLPFAQLLALLDQNIGWTEQVGEAFLAQQADVAQSIQRLRERAAVSGALQSSPEEQVTLEGSDRLISPTNADVVYVPVYVPEVVFSPWPWPDQPPLAFVPPPGGIWVGPIYWCAPVAGAHALWGGWNWQRGSVVVNLPLYNNAYNAHLITPAWGFVVAHRKGVPFHLAALASRYPSAASTATQAAANPDRQRLALPPQWPRASSTVARSAQWQATAPRSPASFPVVHPSTPIASPRPAPPIAPIAPIAPLNPAASSQNARVLPGRGASGPSGGASDPVH